jgi:hypothetical protein
MDIGQHVIAEVYAAMMIDQEWSVREDHAFTWWGHRLAQRVSAEPARDDHGASVVRVTLATNLLRDVDIDALSGNSEKLSMINRSAMMSAYVGDVKERAVSLVSTIYAHEGNLRFATHLAKGAAAMQAAEAHAVVDDLAKLLNGEPDESAHPENGARSEADDMLNAVAMFAASGRDVSPYGIDLESVSDTLGELGFVATETQYGITAELPCKADTPAAAGGTGTALLEVEAMERHPRIGSGVLILLKTPFAADPVFTSALAIRLNSAEALEGAWVRAPLLGGWCVSDEGAPTYSAFLPTQLYGRGLLSDVVVGQALRARWAGDFLLSIAPGLAN